jgi:hypothetical protein
LPATDEAAEAQGLAVPVTAGATPALLLAASASEGDKRTNIPFPILRIMRVLINYYIIILYYCYFYFLLLLFITISAASGEPKVTIEDAEEEEDIDVNGEREDEQSEFLAKGIHPLPSLSYYIK